MNRIQHRIDEDLDRSVLQTPWAASGISEGFQPEGELESCHCIFTPKHYERNYAYPLVVWLHGPNDDERQVTRVMPLVSDRNYVAVGPRGTVPGPSAGFTWSQHPDEIERAEGRVIAAIAAAQAWLNIEPARIFLAGLGAGGTMAFRLALAQPQRFAGVLSIGGAFPNTHRPLARYQAPRRMHVFLAAGREGRDYSEVRICRDLRLFHAASMSVCMRLYPCGDEVTTCMLSDMDRWIMEQVAPQPVAAGESSHESRRK
ncbi:MAG: PHB depolymerase family esterase [Pirellulales bacterium]